MLERVSVREVWTPSAYIEAQKEIHKENFHYYIQMFPVEKGTNKLGDLESRLQTAVWLWTKPVCRAFGTDTYAGRFWYNNVQIYRTHWTEHMSLHFWYNF